MDEKYRKMLTPLIENYRKSLSKEADDLEKLWNTAKKDVNKLPEFAHKIHNMKGTAGLLGFEDICKSAETIQHLLRISGCDKPLNIDETKQVDELVEKIKSKSKEIVR